MKSWWIKARPVVLGGIVYALARLVGYTLRTREVNPEVLDRLKAKGGALLVSWHGRTLVPANVYRGRRYWAIISLSNDGEIQNNIFTRFGFHTIRGSTKRGGVRAALQAAREVSKGGFLAFTPDGPRGPNKKVQPGLLFIAQKSGAPIIPVGVAAHPARYLPTWDRYLIPYPFARAVVIYGEPISVPADADEQALADLTLQIEHAINVMEEEADRRVRGRQPELPNQKE